MQRISLKKQEGLDISKTSVTRIVTVINSSNYKALTQLSTQKSKFTNLTSDSLKNINDTIKLNTEDVNKRIKPELDVSNIITLEQDVTDDLIINQKDDKLLLSSLYDDENNFNYNPLAVNSLKQFNIDLEKEEILDDRWVILSK